METIPDSAVTVTQGQLVVKAITAYDLQSKTLIGQQVRSVLYVRASVRTLLCTDGEREYNTLLCSLRLIVCY